MSAAVAGTSAVSRVRVGLENGRTIAFQGVAPSAQARIIAELGCETGAPIVVVCRGEKEQAALYHDIEAWRSLLTNETSIGANVEVASDQIYIYPRADIQGAQNSDWARDPQILGERQSALIAVSQKAPNQPLWIVATVDSLNEPAPRPERLNERIRHLRIGETLNPMELAQWLDDRGYEPETQVTGKCEYAMRGGIVDVFPATETWPIRVEFFGDDVESIREFDPLTQLSAETIESVRLTPANEEALEDSSGGSLLDYLDGEAIFVFSDGGERSDMGIAELEAIFEGALGSLPRGARRALFYSELDPGADHVADLRLYTIEAHVARGSGGGESEILSERRRLSFFESIQEWLQSDFRTYIVCNNEGERDRFRELWEEYERSQKLVPSSRRFETALASISSGYIDSAAREVFICDCEIFGRYRAHAPRSLSRERRRGRSAALAMDFHDFEIGDFVVHLEYGIGLYRGIQLVPGANGASQERLVIEYAGQDGDVEPPKLLVPVTEAHLVAKYVGAGKETPRLNSLTGKRWSKARGEAQRSVDDLAAEFLRIQAMRETLEGHAFGEDTTWQREFEAAFLYEETRDQLRAIEEIKRDMEGPRPMDRLLCGDVGFGKTEVAIRAAFKAVMDGKQVALLAPTTVLTQQHFNTFRERMADYPIRMECLSRFRSKTQQRRTLEALAAGQVDIVIGTHRLTQKDVRFKDLGLVIVDEEQRFGVTQKETLKRMRELVDVLSMSATPIPRTLHLALTGARDMSVIETAPQERLPVETVVTPYDQDVIAKAIRREMNRGGQTFFLHNRIDTIETEHRKLLKALPEARVLVGHGQMSGEDLENIMTAFVNGEADVLLSTTIIESGIDIPNANTIIIDRADRFGLSQLYQLRGRVGRHTRQAYAYLLLPGHQRLLTDVRKRMSAIKRYSKLGSGFRIAMRDLEIRGAGNLLGDKQSGHITAVGFDLYCKLLKQSVDRLQGKKTVPCTTPVMRIDFLTSDPGYKNVGRPVEVATLPVDYIPDERLRLEVYRRLAEVGTQKEFLDMKSELRDRFGRPPKPVEFLLLSVELRMLAAARQFQEVETRGDRILLKRYGDYVMFGGHAPRFSKKGAKARLGELKNLIREF